MARTNLEDNFVVSGEDVNLNTTNSSYHIHDGPSCQSFPVRESDLFDTRRGLLSACRDRDLDLAKELLKTNYFNFTAINYTDAENSNNTALHICAMTNSTAIASKLLKHPMINVNARNDHADTPLIIASRLGHIKIVILLLRKSGVNLHIKNWHRHTALAEALDNGHTEIASLLQNHPHGVFDIEPQHEQTEDTYDDVSEVGLPLPCHSIDHNALSRNNDVTPSAFHDEGVGIAFSDGSLGLVLPLVDCDNLDPNLQNGDGDAYLVTVSFDQNAEAGLSFRPHNKPGVKLWSLGFCEIDFIAQQGDNDTNPRPVSINEQDHDDNGRPVSIPGTVDTNDQFERSLSVCHSSDPAVQDDTVDDGHSDSETIYSVDASNNEDQGAKLLLDLVTVPSGKHAEKGGTDPTTWQIDETGSHVTHPSMDIQSNHADKSLVSVAPSSDKGKEAEPVLEESSKSASANIDADAATASPTNTSDIESAAGHGSSKANRPTSSWNGYWYKVVDTVARAVLPS